MISKFKHHVNPIKAVSMIQKDLDRNLCIKKNYLDELYQKSEENMIGKMLKIKFQYIQKY